MYDFLGMDMLQGTQKLMDDFCSILLIQNLLLFSKVIDKLATSAELHTEIDISLIIIRFIIVYDIRMITLLNKLNFIVNFIDLLDAKLLFVDCLDSKLTRGILLIGSFVNRTKGSLTQPIFINVISFL